MELTTKDYIKHCKKEVPLFLSLVTFGVTAVLAKTANKDLKPKIDSKLNQ